MKTNTIFTVIAALILAGFSFCAFAEQRIGVINKNALLEQSTIGKSIKDRLEKEADTKRKELESKQLDLQKKQQNMIRDKDILSDKDKMLKEQEFNRLQKELQHMHEQFQSEFEDKYNLEFQQFDKLLNRVIGKVAKEEKLDIILPDQVVIYSESKIDVTAKVVTALNKEKAS